ncbi:MAG: S41 family peptidase, partial [Verrucomicrobiota bacterium]
KLHKAAKNLVDDYELQITAAFLSSKLDAPMILLNSSITQAFWGEKLEESDDEGQVSLKRLDDQSVVLSIRSFTHQAGIETGEAIDEIARNEYANLFIDLRGSRGTIPSAMLQISKYIIEEPMVVGFAPNRKWYAANEGPPTLKDVDKFNTFTEGSFREFIDSAAQGNGQILKISPSEHSFQGRVFLLINGSTQGFAEMIIAGLKRENVVVIAGESSAGSMRLLRPLRIGPDLELLLSANDFVNLEGESIRSSPIEPHVKVDLDEDYAFVAALLEGQ